MREQIRITVALDYDADATRSPAEQCADVLEDVARLLDPDSESGVELIAATLAKHDAESQIYSGTARNAFTRSGFHSFTVARCGEWHGSHCERIGWTQYADRAKRPDSVFWTVYGLRIGHGSQAVADLKTRASALCMADALADGRAVDCDDSPLPPFRVTWETVTAESAEHGDADARGFVRHDGARETLDAERLDPAGDLYNMRLRDALEALEASAGNLESLEPSESDHAQARWITANYYMGDTDANRIGESLSLHLPDSITPASRARLVRLICKR